MSISDSELPMRNRVSRPHVGKVGSYLARAQCSILSLRFFDPGEAPRNGLKTNGTIYRSRYTEWTDHGTQTYTSSIAKRASLTFNLKHHVDWSAGVFGSSNLHSAHFVL
jgi:hypothetical protein